MFGLLMYIISIRTAQTKFIGGVNMLVVHFLDIVTGRVLSGGMENIQWSKSSMIIFVRIVDVIFGGSGP
jgi:hypothetical protein